MLYNNYEEYMRNVLGYSRRPISNMQNYNMPNNMYQSYNNNYNNMYSQIPMNQYDENNQLSNIEQMYPEIYKVINPLVCQKCDNNTQPITEGLVEQMTNEIYDNVVNRVEIENYVNININTREAENRECNGNMKNSSTSCLNRQGSVVSNSKIKDNVSEDRSPVPRRQNRLLRDLIRILILNRLLRRRRPAF